MPDCWPLMTRVISRSLQPLLVSKTWSFPTETRGHHKGVSVVSAARLSCVGQPTDRPMRGKRDGKVWMA